MDITYMHTTDLIPYDRNTKIHDQTQINNVAASIKAYGFVQPIVVDANNTVIIGHCRLAAAKQLGLDSVPVVRADQLTPDQVQALRLIDNKTNESPWDIDLLRSELDGLDLSSFNIDWGLDSDDAASEDDVEEDDCDGTVPDDPQSKPGDIYLLGRHRVMCGDSTNQDDINKLLSGVTIDLLVTDPPYGVDYTGGTKDKLKIANDNLHGDVFIDFLTASFASIAAHMRPGAAFYIWHADARCLPFLLAFDRIGWQVRQKLIWAKDAFTLGRQDYQWQHEACFYGWIDGGPHYFTDKRNLSTVIDYANDIQLDKLRKDDAIALLRKIFAVDPATTIIRADKPIRSALHPTMKPLKLIGELVTNSSKAGDNVADIFGGSGSTLMVCEQTNRTCYTMEYDPHYVDAIIQRWEEYTGDKAVKIN